MALVEVLFTLDNEAKAIVRNIENLNRRLVKANLAVLFNEQCIIYIYIYKCFKIISNQMHDIRNE